MSEHDLLTLLQIICADFNIRSGGILEMEVELRAFLTWALDRSRYSFYAQVSIFPGKQLWERTERKAVWAPERLWALAQTVWVPPKIWALAQTECECHRRCGPWHKQNVSATEDMGPGTHRMWVPPKIWALAQRECKCHRRYGPWHKQNVSATEDSK